MGSLFITWAVANWIWHSDEDILHLSRKRNDSAGLVLGHLSSGRDLMLVGRFIPSRSHFEEVIAPARHQACFIALSCMHSTLPTW
jgi:hypothetical protein